MKPELENFGPCAICGESKWTHPNVGDEWVCERCDASPMVKRVIRQFESALARRRAYRPSTTH
jgi:hypothetical protein